MKYSLPILLLALVGLSAMRSPPTYTTRFDGAEDPISEAGRWVNNSLDWSKIRKKSGLACGTQTGTNTGIYRYDDSFRFTSMAFRKPKSGTRRTSRATLASGSFFRARAVGAWARTRTSDSRVLRPGQSRSFPKPNEGNSTHPFSLRRFGHGFCPGRGGAFSVGISTVPFSKSSPVGRNVS